MNSSWHFYLMMFVSFILFFIIIRIVLGKEGFIYNIISIVALSIIVIIAGMMFGKYGANMGLPWWIYYPVPMLMNVILPPVVLKMNQKQTIFYLVLSFLSAPCIHILFSLLLGWKEYLPFWNIPSLKELIR
ncbi:MAG TPA: hypothetical protein VK622_08810 [Puia sp.]|nr:hypothetical protein [Puia sp.]